MDMIAQPLYAAVMAGKSLLADVLERWQQEQRLDWSQLARMAGISRGTINNIRQGNSVTSDSLRKLAKGLATHPNTGAFDPKTHTRALRELFEAGGFIVTPEYPARDLRAMIADVLGPDSADHPERAEQILRELATLPPHLQDVWLDMQRINMLGLRADAPEKQP
jgi:transcriptional regulator with XRE-family HTH domain